MTVQQPILLTCNIPSVVRLQVSVRGLRIVESVCPAKVLIANTVEQLPAATVVVAVECFNGGEYRPRCVLWGTNDMKPMGQVNIELNSNISVRDLSNDSSVASHYFLSYGQGYSYLGSSVVRIFSESGRLTLGAFSARLVRSNGLYKKSPFLRRVCSNLAGLLRLSFGLMDIVSAANEHRVRKHELRIGQHALLDSHSGDDADSDSFNDSMDVNVESLTRTLDVYEVDIELCRSLKRSVEMHEGSVKPVTDADGRNVRSEFVWPPIVVFADPAWTNLPQGNGQCFVRSDPISSESGPISSEWGPISSESGSCSDGAVCSSWPVVDPASLLLSQSRTHLTLPGEPPGDSVIRAFNRFAGHSRTDPTFSCLRPLQTKILALRRVAGGSGGPSGAGSTGRGSFSVPLFQGSIVRLTSKSGEFPASLTLHALALKAVEKLCMCDYTSISLTELDAVFSLVQSNPRSLISIAHLPTIYLLAVAGTWAGLDIVSGCTEWTDVEAELFMKHISEIMATFVSVLSKKSKIDPSDLNDKLGSNGTISAGSGHFSASSFQVSAKRSGSVHVRTVPLTSETGRDQSDKCGSQGAHVSNSGDTCYVDPDTDAYQAVVALQFPWDAVEYFVCSGLSRMAADADAADLQRSSMGGFSELGDQGRIMATHVAKDVGQMLVASLKGMLLSLRNWACRVLVEHEALGSSPSGPAGPDGPSPLSGSNPPEPSSAADLANPNISTRHYMSLVSESALLFFLPQLVLALRNDVDGELVRCLVSRARTSYPLCSRLYWLLQSMHGGVPALQTLFADSTRILWEAVAGSKVHSCSSLASCTSSASSGPTVGASAPTVGLSFRSLIEKESDFRHGLSVVSKYVRNSASVSYSDTMQGVSPSSMGLVSTQANTQAQTQAGSMLAGSPNVESNMHIVSAARKKALMHALRQAFGSSQAPGSSAPLPGDHPGDHSGSLRGSPTVSSVSSSARNSIEEDRSVEEQSIEQQYSRGQGPLAAGPLIAGSGPYMAGSGPFMASRGSSVNSSSSVSGLRVIRASNMSHQSSHRERIHYTQSEFCVPIYPGVLHFGFDVSKCSVLKSAMSPVVLTAMRQCESATGRSGSTASTSLAAPSSISQAAPCSISLEAPASISVAAAGSGSGAGSASPPQDRSTENHTVSLTGKTFMYKTSDDLRQDMIVMRVIGLVDALWKHYGLDLRLTEYIVLPTGPTDGFVEFVPDSVNLASIITEGSARNTSASLGLGGGTGNEPLSPAGSGSGLTSSSPIHEFLARDQTRLADRFTSFSRSCAGYCVLTYVLGVGDRHLDNLLLNRDGALFHVDFAYILGRDPKLFPPPMKLCREMVEALGGGSPPSQTFREFVLLCKQAFHILRKHRAQLISALTSMVGCGISQIDENSTLEPVLSEWLHASAPVPGIDVHALRLVSVTPLVRILSERLMLELPSEIDAETKLEALIYESINALFPVVLDQFHKWALYWKS